MRNLTSAEKVTKAITELKLNITGALYPHIWTLIDEIEALRKENEELRNYKGDGV